MAIGSVVAFNELRGFGFIADSESGSDIFFHFSEVQTPVPRYLTPGERVEYEILTWHKGVKAVHVVPIEGEFSDSRQLGTDDKRRSYTDKSVDRSLAIPPKPESVASFLTLLSQSLEKAQTSGNDTEFVAVAIDALQGCIKRISDGWEPLPSAPAEPMLSTPFPREEEEDRRSQTIERLNRSMAEVLDELRAVYGEMESLCFDADVSEAVNRAPNVGQRPDRREEKWQRQYQKLAEFFSVHGHSRIPHTEPIYLWANYQRERLKLGRLPAEQKSFLDRFAFDWGSEALAAEETRKTAANFIQENALWDFHLAELKEFRRRNGHLQVPKTFPASRTLPEWLEAQRSRVTELSLRQLRLLWNAGVRFGSVENLWFFQFFKLVEGKEKYRSPNDPRIWAEDRALESWVRVQRSYRNQGRLRSDRIALLTQIGLIWDGREGNWETRLAEVLAYKERFGHALVPMNWEENPSLGKWLAKQRARIKHLSSEHRRKLVEAGCLTHIHQQDWEDRLADWITHAEDQSGMPAGLVSWVRIQRVKKRRGELSDEQIRKFETAGFVWEPQEELWNSRYQELVQYRQQRGHCHIPKPWPENPRLLTWYMNQKNLGNRGKLAPERKAKLDAVGFPWHYNDVVWERMYKSLAEFRALYGHCRIAPNDEDSKLYLWTTRQRRFRSDGALPQDRIARLDALEFEWYHEGRVSEPAGDIPAAIDKVVSFHKRHGRCPGAGDAELHPNAVAACGVINRSRDYLPAADILRLARLGFDFGNEDSGWIQHFCELAAYCDADRRLPAGDPFALGKWCAKQRARWRDGVLAPYRQKWLDEIGFCWKSRHEVWDERLEELKAYKEQFGDCLVPIHAPANKKLGQWIFVQRRLFRTGKLEPERKAKLEEIGFVWRVR